MDMAWGSIDSQMDLDSHCVHTLILHYSTFIVEFGVVCGCFGVFKLVVISRSWLIRLEATFPHWFDEGGGEGGPVVGIFFNFLC